jgi:hypothetical protein
LVVKGKNLMVQEAQMKSISKIYGHWVAAFYCSLIVVGCMKPLDLTVSEPRIYSDSQVRKTLDERRQALSTVATTIQDSALQEIIGIRQAHQLNVNLTVQTTPSTTPPTAATATPPTTTSLTLPTAPTAPAGLGLTFQSLLRKAVERDQLITGLQLLYKGDQYFLDENSKILLLRFDVSVNGYRNATNMFGWLWGGEPQFARIAFEATPYETPGVPMDAGIRVYHLMPDLSSIASQESLISSQLDNLTLAGAGVTGTTTLQGSASNQRALEESFISILEQPLEFAIYGSGGKAHPNRFGFGFGPRRRIEQRSWINPARIFGNKYDLTYVMEPGPRELYAILIVPCKAKSLDIKYMFAKNIQHKDLYTSMESQQADPVTRAAQHFTLELEEFAEACSPPSGLDGKSMVVMPQSLSPNLTNSLLVTTSQPVSSEALVWIDNIAIPPQNISVVGRYQLKVTVPNDALAPHGKPNDSLSSAPQQANSSLTTTTTSTAMSPPPTSTTSGTTISPMQVIGAGHPMTTPVEASPASASTTPPGAKISAPLAKTPIPLTVLDACDPASSGLVPNKVCLFVSIPGITGGGGAKRPAYLSTSLNLNSPSNPPKTQEAVKTK